MQLSLWKNWVINLPAAIPKLMIFICSSLNCYRCETYIKPIYIEPTIILKNRSLESMLSGNILHIISGKKNLHVENGISSKNDVYMYVHTWTLCDFVFVMEKD